MSFSATVKNELARILPEQEEPQIAELSALLRTTGAIRLVGLNKLAFSVSTENPAIARKIFLLIKNCFGINVEIKFQQGSAPKKTRLYHLSINHEQGANEILERIGIVEMQQDGLHLLEKLPKKIIAKQEARRAYIRGAFLGCGSITNPERLYHMEFAITDIGFGKKLSKLLNSYEITAKMIQRKNMHVIYIKDSEKIIDMLSLMGAHKALFKMENIRAKKQILNNINRVMNFDTANINKTISTAQRQIDSINYILETKGLHYLPENLREIAQLRVENYEVNLKELGQLMEKPLGKSGVNHRLKKIEEIAYKLREMNNVFKDKED